MFYLELTDSEANMLRAVLNSYLSELRFEISNTDNFDLREERSRWIRSSRICCVIAWPKMCRPCRLHDHDRSQAQRVGFAPAGADPNNRRRPWPWCEMIAYSGFPLGLAAHHCPARPGDGPVLPVHRRKSVTQTNLTAHHPPRSIQPIP
ncbi:MAG: hypothetical protein HZY76_09315 [Anaerolineae bacterium]|nr:MAG: hypothetical protein HZY76_09315 [Anaerolineae bacterium]